MRDVGTVECDAATSRRQEFGEQIEERSLACTVWPDKGMDVSSPDLQIYIVNRHETLELLGQATRFQNELS